MYWCRNNYQDRQGKFFVDADLFNEKRNDINIQNGIRSVVHYVDEYFFMRQSTRKCVFMFSIELEIAADKKAKINDIL